MITISPITPIIFNQLYREYNETLSCPCSTTMVPYKNFVSQKFTFHPVCSSIFVSQQWIEALYLFNATKYVPFDFRTTASSQFKLLSSFCLLSQMTVLQSQNELKNNEFTTISLLPEAQVNSTVNATVQFFHNTSINQIISHLNYLRATNQGNTLISSLNTNTMVVPSGVKFMVNVFGAQIAYCQRHSNDIGNIKRETCGIENPVIQGGFLPASDDGTPMQDITCKSVVPDFTPVKGFFTGCTPFEGSFFTFLLITWLSTKLDTVKVWNPSLFDYNNLERLNSNTLICPCSTTLIPYHTFISLSPSLHQVCSSDFVSDRWISVLKNSIYSKMILTFDLVTDWRHRGSSQFQLLSNLCQLANRTIESAIHRFIYQSFAVSNLLSEDNFNAYFNRTFTQLLQSTTSYFSVLVETERLLLQVDQPSAALIKDVQYIFNSNIRVNVTLNVTTNKYSSHLTLHLTEIRNKYFNSITCICGTNPDCQTPSVIIQKKETSGEFYLAYVVPGSIVSCYAIDSLFLSTLECLYTDVDCFSILMNYVKEAYLTNTNTSLWADVHPLVHDSTSSQYTPNTSVGMILKKLMIEQWNPISTYEKFYKLCAPIYCTYSQKIRKETILTLTIKMISMIAGLTVSLKLITPLLIKIIFKLLSIINKRHKNRQEEQQRGNV
ncbi:unnamed protein product [Adineta steineri]|uniref:Uncharacterized protein n=1 Tax=Adineta steineri TaxID=433720 RepID=A0A818VFE3_9BILA|nr:unnamed protein product [Adineta steineri]CAF3711954.1 unnamed protein product [Adineta steineri]